MISVQKIFTLTCFCLLLGTGLSNPPLSLAEDYSFDLDEFEKKSFSWGGYAELKLDHNWINRNGAFALLEFYDKPRADLDRLTSTVQLDGNYNKGMVDFNWLLQASAQKDQIDSEQTLDIFSAYASIKPAPAVTFELGKKTFKWGKGYAWTRLVLSIVPKIPTTRKMLLKAILESALT